MILIIKEDSQVEPSPGEEIEDEERSVDQARTQMKRSKPSQFQLAEIIPLKAREWPKPKWTSYPGVFFVSE